MLWISVLPGSDRSRSIFGNGIERLLADAGYRGHNAPLSHRFRVYTSGQKRRVTPSIKREMKRLGAVQPVIGHIKNEHRSNGKAKRIIKTALAEWTYAKAFETSELRTAEPKNSPNGSTAAVTIDRTLPSEASLPSAKFSKPQTTN